MNKVILNNQSLSTNTTFTIPSKWHNLARGLQTLAFLFYVANQTQTLILVSKFSYINYFFYSSLIFMYGSDLRNKYEDYILPEVLVLDLNRAKNMIAISNQLVDLSTYILRKNEILIFSKKFIYMLNDYEEFYQDANILNTYLKDNENDPIKLIIGELIINARTNILTSRHFDGSFNEKIMLNLLITNTRVCICLFNHGISIKENIKNAMNIEYDHEFQYLEATLKRGFSTKKTNTGGLGLYTIDQIVKDSFGKIEMVSGKGCIIKDYNKPGLNVFLDLNYTIPFTSVYIELAREKIIFLSNIKKSFNIVDKLGS